MKRLKFTLLTNDKVIIDDYANYIETNNILKFRIKDELYEYQLTNDILIKKGKESIIEISFKEKVIKIKLNDVNQDFYMDIEDEKIKKEANRIELMYTFINDEKNTNCIIIEYK